MNELFKRLSHDLLSADPEVEFRIKSGIEMYRKGFARLELCDAQGKPVKRAGIRARQIDHEYLFGCNAFLINQFKTPERNAGYEKLFSELFNEAVVPFYWSDFEPEPGKLRVAVDDPPEIYRRPQSERVMNFCRANRITPKGHPLCWHCYMPEWAPRESGALMRALDRRIRQLAELYGDEIFIWDTVNESQTRFPDTREDNPAFPDNYVDEVFRLAERYFPTAALIYNDDRTWWNYQTDTTPLYLLARSLIDRGRRLGGLGMQYHMFDFLLQEDYKFFMNPRHLFHCLDQYGKLNVPLNLSEVSIISRRDLGDGDAFQALVAEKLYRLWFSHPATDSIVWWNLVDGTAAYCEPGGEDGENSLRAGLVNYDLSPKPAYLALKNLIHKEWHTEAKLDYRQGAPNMFHGFYGHYELEIDTGAGKQKKRIFFTKNYDGKYRIKLD